MREWLIDIAGAIGMIVFIAGLAAAASGVAMWVHRTHQVEEAGEP
jgi:hypothetical protein